MIFQVGCMKKKKKKKNKCDTCLQGGVYCPPDVKPDDDKCKQLRKQCKVFMGYVNLEE